MADKEATIQLERYSADAKQLVKNAQQLADERQHAEVTPLHLLVRLLDRDRGIAEVFRRAGFTHFRKAAETPFNLVFEVRR